jgi:hypothetical protein
MISVLQEAIYSALSTISGVKVYDSVPETVEMPYIRIGDDSFSSSETKDGSFKLMDCEINVFSDYRGYQSIKNLTDQVLDKLSVINYSKQNTTVQFWDLVGMSFYRDEDNARRANISARFMVCAA